MDKSQIKSEVTDHGNEKEEELFYLKLWQKIVKVIRESFYWLIKLSVWSSTWSDTSAQPHLR